MNSVFFDLTVILILAGLIAVLISLLKQPSIIAYIITGLIIGPLGYYQLRQSDVFGALGQVGITLLLFMVGLELDIGQLKRIGRTALLTGIGQVGFTTIAGFFILRALHFSPTACFYLAPALTFSSTIIVVKLLSEKRDLQSLYGKIVVGIFLMQDFVAIMLLILLSSASSSTANIYGNLPVWQNIVFTLVRMLILGLLVSWLAVKVFPKILQFMGKSDELLLVFSLSWALGLATFVSLPFMGFSLEIGGFLAGLALARSAVHYEISARIKSLRDFFIVLFFIVLGSGLAVSNLSQMIRPAILISLFVLIGNPLIVMVLLALQGYKPRTGFFAGVTVGQVSEFSLILGALGLKLGALKQEEVGLLTLVGIITIALSSYMIQYSSQLFEKLKWLLKIFDFRKGVAEKGLRDVVLKNHIILIGGHRMGHHLVGALAKQDQPFVLVDFNPEIVERYREQNILAICGDISDPYIQEQVNLPFAKLIISTVPDFNDNLALIDAIKKCAPKRRKPKLIFIAQDEEEIKRLYAQEIDYVISPHFMGGLHLAKILEEDHNMRGLKKLRERHLKILNR
jgi:Kef-type K+ transport system membrane component KefB/voltage-gated potassium channel Kch